MGGFASNYPLHLVPFPSPLVRRISSPGVLGCFAFGGNSSALSVWLHLCKWMQSLPRCGLTEFAPREGQRFLSLSLSLLHALLRTSYSHLPVYMSCRLRYSALPVGVQRSATPFCPMHARMHGTDLSDPRVASDENASKHRGDNASKRKPTRSNVDKRKQTLTTPPFTEVSYTPFCNPLTNEVFQGWCVKDPPQKTPVKQACLVAPKSLFIRITRL